MLENLALIEICCMHVYGHTRNAQEVTLVPQENAIVLTTIKKCYSSYFNYRASYMWLHFPYLYLSPSNIHTSWAHWIKLEFINDHGTKNYVTLYEKCHKYSFQAAVGGKNCV